MNESRVTFRRLRRGMAQRFSLALAGWAARGGPDRVRRTGQFVGDAHWLLAWPAWHRLRKDVARALQVDRRQASRILRGGARTNDGAIFEALTLGRPGADPAALVDTVDVLGTDRLDRLVEQKQGAILLGMHMGNGILMAGRLAAAGYPVHIVFREPRRLTPGTLHDCIAATPARPIPLDRENPTRSFRQMLRALNDGGLIYVLMDQASKQEGRPRPFLGKTQRTPTGVLKLAARAAAPIVPVDAIQRWPRWVYEVGEPLTTGPDLDSTLDAVVAHMEQRVRQRPELWSWHQRRWKRYDFATRDSLADSALQRGDESTHSARQGEPPCR
jgi:lauroyl/myristoyl acyltransferase